MVLILPNRPGSTHYSKGLLKSGSLSTPRLQTGFGEGYGGLLAGKCFKLRVRFCIYMIFFSLGRVPITLLFFFLIYKRPKSIRMTALKAKIEIYPNYGSSH